MSFTSQKEKLSQSRTERVEMAQKGVKLDQESFNCSICLDLLKDPVTLSCGHSYCMKCIQSHWDIEDEKGIYSCPQCRQTFTPRPALLRNTMLETVLQQLRKSHLQAAPHHPSHAGPEDVTCDVCSGRKLKAFKSCLQCLISFCEKHLQPHHESPVYERHKLVDPCRRLQENVCSRHDEVMKLFCRTDQEPICYVCSVDQHKGHDTVSAAAERSQKQRELVGSRQSIQQRIEDREKDVKLLQHELKIINVSADRAVEHSQKIFSRLIRLLQKRGSEVEQQVRSQQKTEVNRVEELQETLEQEITELKRKDAELQKLSHTDDHNQFLRCYPSLSALSGYSASVKIRPLTYFQDVTAAVSSVRDQLQEALTNTWTNVSKAEVDVLLSEPAEPKTRDDFLRYSREVTLDPNTAHKRLILSKENTKATWTGPTQPYPPHPDRFTDYSQVLSRESLSGCCYWEVKWGGGGVSVAVSYKNISRSGGSSSFGANDRSWTLECFSYKYKFYHNNVITPVSGPYSSRVGVYLDHRAGTLSFYRVSKTMTLLHRVQTTFTQPLHAGLMFGYHSGDSAEFIKLE